MSERRAPTSQPDVEFDNVKRHATSYIFECIFWFNGSFFSGGGRDILKEEVKTFLMAQSSPTNLRIFFPICTSVDYSLCQDLPRESRFFFFLFQVYLSPFCKLCSKVRMIWTRNHLNLHRFSNIFSVLQVWSLSRCQARRQTSCQSPTKCLLPRTTRPSCLPTTTPASPSLKVSSLLGNCPPRPCLRTSKEPRSFRRLRRCLVHRPRMPRRLPKLLAPPLQVYKL